MIAPRWRNWSKKIVFVLACAGTLLTLLYAEENWRAARAWAACEQSLSARGEPLHFALLEGPSIRRERNLAYLPFFAKHWRYVIEPTTGRITFAREQPPSPDIPRMPRSQPGQPFLRGGLYTFDLPTWQEYLRGKSPAPSNLSPAQEVLNALRDFDGVVNELHAAREAMPAGEFREEHDWTKGSEPDSAFRTQMDLNFTLTLLITAQLAAGNHREALRNIELGLWLHRAFANDPPTLLSMMKGCALLSCTGPIKNGLDAGQWTASQIARLQGDLDRIDLLTDYRHAMRGERALLVEALDHSPQKPSVEALFQKPDDWRDRLLLFACFHGPRGWLVQNKVAMSNYVQEACIDPCDPSRHRMDMARFRAAGAAFDKIAPSPNPHNFLHISLFRFMGEPMRVIAGLQSRVDESAVRCALARYAMDHDRRFPAQLSELVPQYLDQVLGQIEDGAPIPYKVNPDGRYELGGSEAK